MTEHELKNFVGLPIDTAVGGRPRSCSAGCTSASPA